MALLAMGLGACTGAVEANALYGGPPVPVSPPVVAPDEPAPAADPENADTPDEEGEPGKTPRKDRDRDRDRDPEAQPVDPPAPGPG